MGGEGREQEDHQARMREGRGVVGSGRTANEEKLAPSEEVGKAVRAGHGYIDGFC